MPDWIIPALATALLSCGLTVALTVLLKRRSILDHPNERSLHTIPTPRGGGWAILAAFAIGLAMLRPGMSELQAAWPIIAGLLLLVAVSWLDDLKTLSALPRFATQIVAVGLGLLTLHGGVFQGWLPRPLDYAVTAFCWLWFVNLFNFMDGMDGLAGGEALAVSYGLFLIMPETPACIILTAAVLGFLTWNWGPARIILGDVGSIPLGYLLAALLFRAAEAGHWEAALLLPLYFLTDATVTLLKRLRRGEKIWRAHRQHFYQQAVLAGRTHRQVASAVLIANAGLVFCAVALAPDFPKAALLGGMVIVAALCGWMARGKA